MRISRQACASLCGKSKVSPVLFRYMIPTISALLTGLRLHALFDLLDLTELHVEARLMAGMTDFRDTVMS